MSAIELVPDGCAPRTTATHAYWGTASAGAGALQTTMDAWFTQFGVASDTAIGLARIGVAAFIADRMTRRRIPALTRGLTIIVHVPDPGALAVAVPLLVDLLSWVTGDEWTIELVADLGARPDSDKAPPVPVVALLSGGLDSFAGAVVAPNQADRAYLSHSDMGISTGSQRRVVEWFDNQGKVLDRSYIWLLPPARTGIESTRRSRAVLFTLLATALADARQADRIEVAENGFTSLNPPLGANRGGVWTTRSTHPHTFHLLNNAIGVAGLRVQVDNPYALLTKGELVTRAKDAGLSSAAASLTHSCARTSQRFVGGSPSAHCGLCYACIVRRGAMLSAFGSDPTPYLVDTLPKKKRAKLIHLRRQDITAVSYAIERVPTVRALLPIGPFDSMDVDDALDLWCRALKELRDVELP